MKQSHHAAGQVEVHVKGNHLVVTDALRAAVMQKMSNLDRYFDKLQNVEVELCHEKTRDSSLHNRVEATTHVKGRTIRVTTRHEDMYAAIDEAVDKLHRSLSRLKERSKAHGSSKIVDSLAQGLELDSSADEEEYESPNVSVDGSPIVTYERVEVQAQFEEEAIQEMNEDGLTFHVFLNARNERLNVLYRHADGTYGLIEPRTR